MAVQPKKTRRKSSSKKSSKNKKIFSNTSTFKKSILIVLAVFVMFSMVAFGYFLGQQNHEEVKKHSITIKVDKTQKKRLKKLVKVETEKPKVIKQQKENNVSDDVPVPVVKKTNHVHLKQLTGKPKLIIIIDDVSSKSQLKKIQALHMKITPSIFPPFKHHMKSHNLAHGLKHYMIHLPMESGSKQFNKHYKTLKIKFSKAEIKARAKELRKLFPTARYVNNHTGSVFTNDYKSMLTLYVALKKEGFMFVDSRTIASTKVPKITKKFTDVYMARDIFIDNVHHVKTIHQQLRKAVAISKKKGYAIAIGHPHTATMKALSTSGSILKDVELIYLDDLMTI